MTADSGASSTSSATSREPLSADYFYDLAALKIAGYIRNDADVR